MSEVSIVAPVAVPFGAPGGPATTTATSAAMTTAAPGSPASVPATAPSVIVPATGAADPLKLCPVCADDVPASSFVVAHPHAATEAGRHEQCRACAQAWIGVQLNERFSIHIGSKPNATTTAAAPVTTPATAALEAKRLAENGDARIGIRCSRCTQCWSQVQLYKVLLDQPKLTLKLDRVMSGISEMTDFQSCPKPHCLGGGIVDAATLAPAPPTTTATATAGTTTTGTTTAATGTSKSVGSALCNVCNACFPVTSAPDLSASLCDDDGNNSSSGTGSDAAGNHSGNTARRVGSWLLAPFGARLVSRAALTRVGRSDAPIKPCPGCHTPIERNAGCDHMTCTRCRAAFCWFCLSTDKCVCSGVSKQRYLMAEFVRDYWRVCVAIAGAFVAACYALYQSWFVFEALAAAANHALWLLSDAAVSGAYTLLLVVALMFARNQWLTGDTATERGVGVSVGVGACAFWAHRIAVVWAGTPFATYATAWTVVAAVGGMAFHHGAAANAAATAQAMQAAAAKRS